MSNQFLIALKPPEKILMIYPDRQIELKLSTSFDRYVVTIDKNDLHKFKDVMYEPSDQERNK